MVRLALPIRSTRSNFVRRHSLFNLRRLQGFLRGSEFWFLVLSEVELDQRPGKRVAAAGCRMFGEHRRRNLREEDR